jgi:hypothetical protein
MLNVSDLARTIVAHTQATGGATVTADGVSLAGSRGYSVALYHEREQTLTQVREEEVAYYCQQNADLIAKPGNCVGAWKDEQDGGMLYLDIVKVIPGRKRALHVGHKAKQIAIFNLVKMHEIRL